MEEIQEVITMSKYGTVKDPAILSKRLQRKEQEKNVRLNKDLGNSNNQSSKGKTREYGSSSHDSKDDDRSSSPRRPIIMPTKEDKEKEAAQQKGLPSSSGVKGVKGVKGGKGRKGRKEGKETASVDLKDPVFRGQLKEAAHVFFKKADKDGKVTAACLSLFSIWTQTHCSWPLLLSLFFPFVSGGGSISPLEFAKTLKEAGKKHAKKNKGAHTRGNSWFNSPFSIYQIIDDDKSGEISEQEFLDYVMSEQSDSMFRALLISGIAKLDNSKEPLPTEKETTYEQFISKGSSKGSSSNPDNTNSKNTTPQKNTKNTTPQKNPTTLPYKPPHKPTLPTPQSATPFTPLPPSSPQHVMQTSMSNVFGSVLLYKDDEGRVVPTPVDEVMQGVEVIGCFYGGAWQQHSLDFTPVRICVVVVVVVALLLVLVLLVLLVLVLLLVFGCVF